MSVSPVLAALRAATADLHQAVETGAEVEARLRDPALRPVMVARLHLLHASFEGAVAPWAGEMERAGHVPQNRSPLIANGLDALGLAQPPPRAPAAVASFGEAIGWTYVAEGSSLGGRVMRRAMLADGIDLTGLDFLDPHGEDTGPRWRGFLTAMDQACAAGRARPADVILGGRDAFTLATGLLAPSTSAEFA